MLLFPPSICVYCGPGGRHRVQATTTFTRKPSESMSKFNIKVARIEATGRGKQIRITFQVDRGPTSFQVPIVLAVGDFDDTEMVQAARSALHRTFAELAGQSRSWKLKAQDLRRLSSMSLRPKP
jgi:hypothetical protein